MTSRLRITLPTLAEVNAVRRATQKGAEPTRQQVKAKKGRAEKAVKVDVRAACVARDGSCRLGSGRSGDHYEFLGDSFGGDCGGFAEWAHLVEKRRSKTRGQAPEVRHTTADSLILCRRHHARYDGRERPRFTIEKLTTRGADGPLRFSAWKY